MTKSEENRDFGKMMANLVHENKWFTTPIILNTEQYDAFQQEFKNLENIKEHRFKWMEEYAMQPLTQDEKYLQWMEEYFNLDGGDELKEDLLNLSEKELSLVWSSCLYGRLGMCIRNYMREKHPEIDEDFENYGKFEDYSWELIQKLIERWIKKKYFRRLIEE